MPTSLEIFNNSIHSKATLDVYTRFLNDFHRFSKVKDFDSFTRMGIKEAEKIIIEYLFYLKNRIEKGAIGPNSISLRMQPIELFMIQNDIMVNFKKIKKMYPLKVKTKGELPYTLDDLQKMQEGTSNPRDKFIISFFASTGARPGSLPDLRMKHLKEMTGGCMAVTIYENDIEEYPGFIIPEGTKYLKLYLDDREFNGEKITSESPVVRNAYRKTTAWRNVKPINDISLKHMMIKIQVKAKIRKRNSNPYFRHDKALFGGFRKWFETTMDNIIDVNPNVVEKLMGHRNDLRGTYYNPDIRVRFENFKKAIPELAINPEIRLREENKKKDKMIEKFEFEAKSEIESVKKQLRENQLTTLELIGDAIKDPEKFKKMLLDKQKET